MAARALPDLIATSDSSCAVPGCPKKRHGVKVCAMHYERWRNHGSFDLPLKPPAKICLVDGCDRLVHATHGGRGLCSLHYQRWRKHRVEGDACAVEGCDLNAIARSLCATHYAQLQRSGRVQTFPSKGRRCSQPDCDRPHLALGYCRLHYKRWQVNGDAAITQRFHGRGSINAQGYRMVPARGHPNAYTNGQIREHALVMATLLGRPLRPEEEVHHRNGDRLDNRPENLELWSGDHPSGQRVEDLVAWARAILTRYQPHFTQLGLEFEREEGGDAQCQQERFQT